MKKELNHLQELFKEYLSDVRLNNEMNIDQEGLVSFHWSNWNLTCRMIKEGPLCLYTKEAIIDELDNRLEQLRENKIWVNNKMQTLESSEYDLYKFYMDPRVRQAWFAKDQSTLYSDESQKGPFTLLTSLKWKDRETFSYFVYKKILMESHQLRQFRLNANLPFVIKFDEFENNDSIGMVRQFNGNGLLIQYRGRSNLAKFQNANNVKFCFEKGLLKKVFKLIEIEDIPFEENLNLKISGDVLKNPINVGEFNGDQYFVFVPFKDLEKDIVGKYISNGLKDVVFQVYSQFDETMSEELSTFHSWVKKVA